MEAPFGVVEHSCSQREDKEGIGDACGDADKSDGPPGLLTFDHCAEERKKRYDTAKRKPGRNNPQPNARAIDRNNYRQAAKHGDDRQCDRAELY
jgi:hypothetical protein